jgi:hypothetical protein
MKMSRNVSVGIAMRYGLDGRFSNPSSAKIFLYSTVSRPAVGPTQSLIQKVPGALSPGVKLLGREADHSTPSSAEVKNVGPIPPLLTCSWHGA